MLPKGGRLVAEATYLRPPKRTAVRRLGSVFSRIGWALVFLTAPSPAVVDERPSPGTPPLHFAAAAQRADSVGQDFQAGHALQNRRRGFVTSGWSLPRAVAAIQMSLAPVSDPLRRSSGEISLKRQTTSLL